MLQAVAKAGATVLERTPFAIDDAQYSSENEDEEDEDEDGDEDEDDEDESEEDEEDEDEDEEEEEDEEDETNEDDQVLNEVDAFLEAHDSGLTEADKEVAKRTFLSLLLVAEVNLPFLL